jgi:hypothetical protein
VGGDRISCLKHRAERTAHVAHTGDAECDEERKDEIIAIRCGVIKEDMGVHIPEARDQKAVLGIDDRAGGRRWAMNDHGSDSASLDNNRTSGMKSSIADIDDGGVRDRECLRRRAESGKQKK